MFHLSPGACTPDSTFSINDLSIYCLAEESTELPNNIVYTVLTPLENIPIDSLFLPALDHPPPQIAVVHTDDPTSVPESPDLVDEAPAKLRCALGPSKCRRSFATQTELDEHNECHVGPSQFRCTHADCGRLFPSLPTLIEHRRRHTGELAFTCKVCGKSFGYSLALSRHIRTHTSDKPFECAHCKRCFSLAANRDRHCQRRHIQRKLLQCDLCPKQLSNDYTLAQHRRKHSNAVACECMICGIRFKRWHFLDRHMHQHTGKCAVCNVEVDAAELPQHMRQHSPLYWCDICDDSSFKSLRLIRLHMDQKHVRVPVFRCKMCPAELPALELHEHASREHFGGVYAWHACPYCDLEFPHLDLLTRHLRDHEGLLYNAMQCNQCGIVFKKYYFYTKHKCFKQTAKDRDNKIKRYAAMSKSNDKELKNTPVGPIIVKLSSTESTPVFRSTTGQNASAVSVQKRDLPKVVQASVKKDTTIPKQVSLKSLIAMLPASKRGTKCPVCAKQFESKRAVRAHLPTHARRQFQCEFCAKAFVRAEQLETHQRTHTGEKPYKCEVCDKRFSQFGRVKVHMLTHTGERPFKCGRCVASFNQMGNLRLHERMHSKNGHRGRPKKKDD